MSMATASADRVSRIHSSQTKFEPAPMPRTKVVSMDVTSMPAIVACSPQFLLQEMSIGSSENINTATRASHEDASG